MKLDGAARVTLRGNRKSFGRRKWAVVGDPATSRTIVHRMKQTRIARNTSLGGEEGAAVMCVAPPRALPSLLTFGGTAATSPETALHDGKCAPADATTEADDP